MTTFLDAKAAQARIAELEAQLAAANKPKNISFKVSEKGAVSVLGLQRFPVTLYYPQWMRLFDKAQEMVRFMETEKAKGTLSLERKKAA